MIPKKKINLLVELGNLISDNELLPLVTKRILIIYLAFFLHIFHIVCQSHLNTIFRTIAWKVIIVVNEIIKI